RLLRGTSMGRDAVHVSHKLSAFSFAARPVTRRDTPKKATRRHPAILPIFGAYGTNGGSAHRPGHRRAGPPVPDSASVRDGSPGHAAGNGTNATSGDLADLLRRAAARAGDRAALIFRDQVITWADLDA